MNAISIFLTAAIGMWPSTFILTAVLFRQKLQSRTLAIILCSMLMALVSLLLQSFRLQYLLTSVQLIAFILCLIFFFRIRFFYSLMMAMVIFMFAIIIETTFYFVLGFVSGKNFIDLSHQLVILPAIVITIMNYLLAIVLYKLRIGFSVIPVVPAYDRWSDGAKHKMKVILVTGMVSVSCLCFALFIWEQWVETIIFAIVAVWIIALYFLYKRELSD